MDFGELITAFGATYQVTRRPRGAFSHGVQVDAAPSTLPIVAAVTPATGRDLQRLPEGRRTTETRRVYTTTKLLVGAQDDPYQADLVSIAGTMFEVQYVDPWLDTPAPGQAFVAVVQAVDTAKDVP